MRSTRLPVRAAQASHPARRRPEPAYVEVGDTVKKKQILALLETMKVFQKVKCPANGKVVEILVESETPLKDDDLMFIIQVE